jgi:hypothetical protein
MIGLPPSAIRSQSTNFQALCVRVEQRLCELGHLLSGQFPMTQREVIRGGKTVGIYFCVHGPRSVKMTAICDFKKKQVIFYGSDGIRKESMNVTVKSPVAHL